MTNRPLTETAAGNDTPSGDDHILPQTRAVAALVVPVLIVAFVILYLLPQQTGQLFAWGIKPPMSAMMLGGTYLGGAYFFTRVFLGKRWHTIKLGLPAVGAFVTYLGIATILHWGNFNHGHISFYLWTFLYFTFPFLLPVVWLWNRSADPGTSAADDVQISSVIRLILAIVSGVLLVFSLILLLLPTLIIPAWPWVLSPLTARVMAAMFVLPAIVGAGIALDGRWSAARIIVEAQGFAIILILGAVIRATDQFDWSRSSSWAFAGGMTAFAVALLVMYAAMERHWGRRQSGGQTAR